MRGRGGKGCAFRGGFGGEIGDGMVGWLRNEGGGCLFRVGKRRFGSRIPIEVIVW